MSDEIKQDYTKRGGAKIKNHKDNFPCKDEVSKNGSKRCRHGSERDMGAAH